MSQFNVGAALAGLTFAATGLLFLLDEVDMIVLRAEVVVPSVVIALGVSVILGALTRPRA
ncbi:MAG: hypothetical protein O2822_04380 [Chloroflexi bacterium]|nr:hypothetical protein [Chloroflexota bacterium]